MKVARLESVFQLQSQSRTKIATAILVMLETTTDDAGVNEMMIDTTNEDDA